MFTFADLSSLLEAGAALHLVEPDMRADDGERRISVDRGRVVIDRVHTGVAMRIVVPILAYRGVCVALRTSAAGRVYHALRLDHADPELSVTLAEAFDDNEIWALWRGWAACLDLPALVERDGGVERTPTDHPAVALSATALPRRRRRSQRRRAAFIRRRQAANIAPAIVLAGTELIARH